MPATESVVRERADLMARMQVYENMPQNAWLNFNSNSLFAAGTATELPFTPTHCCACLGSILIAGTTPTLATRAEMRLVGMCLGLSLLLCLGLLASAGPTPAW